MGGMKAEPFGGGHAIVVGGSMAGLVATRALAGHFDRVTLVERDALPRGPEARKGVPQIRHVHVLLKRGETILARLFPGIVDDLRAGGANCIDMGRDTRWYHFGGWKERFQSGMEFLSQTRPYLEWKIRSRVAALPNVEILEQTDATGFVASTDRTGIVGVIYHHPSGTRLGVVIPVENDCWMVTLVGWFGDTRRATRRGFSSSLEPSTSRTSTRRCRVPSRSPRSRSTSFRRTGAATTSGWPAFPKGSPCSATRSAASTRSTARG